VAHAPRAPQLFFFIKKQTNKWQMENLRNISVRDGDKILLGCHSEGGTWETFGGGLDFGEDLHQALKREILEETGCEVNYVSEQPILALPHIVHNKRGMDWFYNFPIYYEVKFDTSKFDFSLQYSEIKWFSMEELQDLNVFEGEEGIKEAFKSLI
jgi:8-oxo-dGTP pyrophosphatase MutT (NUDIX family)